MWQHLAIFCSSVVCRICYRKLFPEDNHWFFRESMAQPRLLQMCTWQSAPRKMVPVKNKVYHVKKDSKTISLKLLLFKTFMQYILIISFSSTNYYQILPTSLPTQLHVLLPLSLNRYKTKHPTQQKQNKRHTKPWSLLCVGQLLLAWGLPWTVVRMPSVSHPRADFPFLSSHQLIAKWHLG